jgi:hypothetical protein
MGSRHKISSTASEKISKASKTKGKTMENQGNPIIWSTLAALLGSEPLKGSPCPAIPEFGGTRTYLS